MKQLLTAEFNAKITHDPAWAATLTEPVEILDYCNMNFSPITHLSPLLRFTGRNEDGDVASFEQCENLKVAEGTFHGSVNFQWAAIEKIGELIITRTNRAGYAANFDYCKSLKVASGTFPGPATFDHAGIEKIDNLNILESSASGHAASFRECEELKIAEGTYPGYVDFYNSGVEQIAG